MSGWSWGFGGLVAIGVVMLIIVLLHRQSSPRTGASPILPTGAESTSTPKQINAVMESPVPINRVYALAIRADSATCGRTCPPR